MPDEILSVLPFKTCKKCQSVFTGKCCRPCRKIKKKAWKAANKDKVAATAAAYYAANGEKLRARNAAWRAKNPELVKAGIAAYRVNNPEKMEIIHRKGVEASAAWYLANKESVNVAGKVWRDANPDAVRRHSSTRRAKVAGVGGSLSKGITEKLFKLQKGRCPCCKQSLGDDYHLDHKVPIFLGGTNTDDNMQLLRKICNLNKGSKHPVEFMQARGFLL